MTSEIREKREEKEESKSIWGGGGEIKISYSFLNSGRQSMENKKETQIPIFEPNFRNHDIFRSRKIYSEFIDFLTFTGAY